MADLAAADVEEEAEGSWEKATAAEAWAVAAEGGMVVVGAAEGWVRTPQHT